MTLHNLDEYFRSFLQLDLYKNDPSLNGIQVQNSDPKNKKINKVAFAVDACKETIEAAANENADLLFVHHGFFWGSSLPIIENHYERVELLIKNDIALFACHIPLDSNIECGNNYCLARKLNLRNI